MQKRRPKLRLRKQVIAVTPVILFVTIMSIALAINGKRSYAATVEQVEEAAPIMEIPEERKLTNIEFLVGINKYLDTRQKDNTVALYASYFKLNPDKAVEIVRNLTNNYEDENYINTNVVPSSSNQYSSFDSFEAGIAYFVRDVYRYPKRYGTTNEEIRLSNEITVNDNWQNGTLYMSNGLTFEQQYGKICDLFGINKEIGLGIVYQESGIKRSNLFKYSNNIGGLRGYDGWMRFPTLEAGIIAHVLSIKSIVNNYGIDMNSANAIGQLSGIYVNGDINSYAENWVNKVTYFKQSFADKDLFTIS